MNLAMNRHCLIAAALCSACTTGAEVARTASPSVTASIVDPRLTGLQQALVARLATEPGEYGVVVMDVQSGRSAVYQDRLVLHAASTMKVPVLYELFRQIDAGLLRADSLVEVRNRFRSIADSTHFYALDAGDDSESDLYERVGQRLPVRELARRMIVRSSNLATNNLIELVGAAAVQRTIDRLGGTGMTVRRGVEDGPAYQAGLNNTTSAAGLARVLASLARCELLREQTCRDAIRILGEQEHNDMLPAGLPEGTRFAHKTGWITGIQHDGGIVYPDGSPPFVVVLLSRNGSSEEQVRRVAADVARLAWNALGSSGTARLTLPEPAAELVDLHDRVRLPGFVESRLTHDDLWQTLDPVLNRAWPLRRETLGNSAEGRAIELIRFGDGPTGVLLWSQMHGDETTATRALADLIEYMARDHESARVRRWHERLTILMIPMLNPDGAERHQRRNAFGIDVNRDAREQASPEARILKSVQERFQPAYGFNLHDQNPRTRVGESSRLAAISLLAPPPRAGSEMTPQWARAQRLAMTIGRALEPLVGGHLTRYDDTFNPRAFGDLMAQWGVATVLIESGGWAGDPAKRWLRTANFVALVTALDAIATDAHRDADVAWYAGLPENGRPVHDLLIRGGRVVLAGGAEYRADIAIEGTGAEAEVVDVGDLLNAEARDTLQLQGNAVRVLQANGSPAPILRVDEPARLRIDAIDGSEKQVAYEVDGVVIRQLIAGR